MRADCMQRTCLRHSQARGGIRHQGPAEQAVLGTEVVWIVGSRHDESTPPNTSFVQMLLVLLPSSHCRTEYTKANPHHRMLRLWRLPPSSIL